MKTIYKYAIPDKQTFTLTLPQGAQILSVQTQGRQGAMLWALVDSDALPEARIFAVVGTGWQFDPRGMEFIGTYQLNGGEFVFHLFEDRRKATARKDRTG